MAVEILESPGLFPTLLEIALKRISPIGSRACWIVEILCKKDLKILLPHIEAFINGLPEVTRESSIRPMAKVCECLCEAAASVDTAGAVELAPKQRERLIEICFDWLTGPHKVAPKAYSMRCLFLLGRDYPWVWEELQGVLLRYYAGSSPAYRVRARQILKALEKGG